jgi:hypothetical protein
VLLSAFRLSWQLFVLFACSTGLGLAFRSLIPKEFSVLNKVLFLLIGGLSLVVLVAQNLVYLGVPVRISAWLVLGGALLQTWRYRHHFPEWIGQLRSSKETRSLAALVLLTVTFHGVVPVQQGLEWYYGKGHFDQINYVLLAEFLKEEPYSTSAEAIGLRPWLIGPVGFHEAKGELAMSSGPGLDTIGLKNERIGQSLITGEISVWSGTDAKGGYAATVIFFLTVLVISLYAFLREILADQFMAASGALLGVFLPVVTRLSLDGFLSQVGILFIFPFFASLLRHRELSPRSFTLFFSLTLAYLISVYSEMAPIGICVFVSGILFIRSDQARPKRLMFMGAILLIACLNPYYLRNMIEFLGYQYNLAAHAASLWDNVAPDIVTLDGWTAIIFGNFASGPLISWFAGCTILLAILFLAGSIFLARKERLILAAILIPVFLLVLYLATRTPPSYYPIAKITLTLLPFLSGLVFVGLSQVAPNSKGGSNALLLKVFSAVIVITTAAGSVGYYAEVLKIEGMLSAFREPRFQAVCRELEGIRNKCVLVFETQPLLSAWLCYHARHDDVYFDGRMISDSAVPAGLSFSEIPDLEKVDFVVTRDRLVNLRTTSAACLTSVDDTIGEDRVNGRVRYELGPPARLRFLALQAMAADLKMRFTPGPRGTISPFNYFLTDPHGGVFQGEIQGETLEILRMNIPRGISYLELAVKAKEPNLGAGATFPILAELDGLQISGIDAKQGR